MSDSAHETQRRAPTVPLGEEQAVVLRLAQGDRAAFSILYGWYGDAVYRVILARLANREAAEDCLRDTFRTALEKIGSFTYDRRSIFYWLRRIAVNKAMDVHRRRKRDRDLVDRVQQQPHTHTVAEAPPRPDRGLEVEDTARDVETSLSRMNPRYAKALRLRLLDDLTREECARQMEVTVGNFDVILHRATKAFRKVYPP